MKTAKFIGSLASRRATSSCAVGGSPPMAEPDRDALMRVAAFDHVRRLGEVHDHLTATELKPGFAFDGEGHIHGTDSWPPRYSRRTANGSKRRARSMTPRVSMPPTTRGCRSSWCARTICEPFLADTPSLA